MDWDEDESTGVHELQVDSLLESMVRKTDEKIDKLSKLP